MPHIIFKKNNQEISLNNTKKTNFLFHSKGKRQDKIGVSCNNFDFLLTYKKHNLDYMIKPDKATRISNNIYTKTALNDFVKQVSDNIVLSNTSINTKKIKPKDEYLKDIDFFAHNFQTLQEIWIDIGFGSGIHMLYLAKKNPDILFVGIEIHIPSIEQILKQINIHNITNIFILNYDARMFMEFLQSNIVGKIFVHFPVPWNKKPHRRIYSKDFVTQSIRVLKPYGILELRTDSDNYFNFCNNTLKQFKNIDIKTTRNKQLETISKYEQKWLSQNKTIYDLILTSYTISPAQNISTNFDFGKIDIKQCQIPQKPIIKNNFFIHFKDIYKTNNKYLLEVTFGNFNTPVTKFILVTNIKAKYFQSNPIATSANKEAHKLINQILIGVIW